MVKTLKLYMMNYVRKNNRGMSFYIVLGLVAVLAIIFQMVISLVRNEIVQGNIAMRGEVIQHLLESAVEEAVITIRKDMNKHSGMQMGTFYGYFRNGVEKDGTAPAIDCTLTKKMAKKYYGIPGEDITVYAELIDKKNFTEDMLGRKIKVPSGTKAIYASLRIVAKVAYGKTASGHKYSRSLEVRKDIKVVRVLPPYPDFALVVRDGGYPGCNYNQWKSFHGGEKLNFSVIAGTNADATKNGKILFGGGLNEKDLIKMIPSNYPKNSRTIGAWMSGWIPSPTPAQMRGMGLKQWPIIMNMTNYGRNNREVQHLYEDSIQSIPDYYGMTPTSDFHAYGDEKNNLGALVSAIPTQRLPYKLPVIKTNGSGKTTTNEVELTFYRATLGYGSELASKPEKIKPFGLFKGKSEGFINYFKHYQKVYKDTPFDIRGSGIDLLGSDPTDARDHNLRPCRNAMIYGNVMASYVTAHVMKMDSKTGVKTDARAAALPWVNFDNKNDLKIIESPPFNGKVPKEYKKSLAGSILSKLGNLMKFDFKKAAASGYPHCGKEEDQSYCVDIPDALLQKWTGDGMNSIQYRRFMSSVKYFPADPEMFGLTQYNPQYVGKMMFRHQYQSPVTGISYEASDFNEEIPPELLELAPDMASYKFVGPMEFVMYLQHLGLLVQDSKTGVWDLYLDGIWFVQGLISDFRFQTLTLPPPSYDGQPAGAMNIYGKGLIATVEGTEITVGGISEGGDDYNTQLSVVVAPTIVLQNLLQIARTNPDLIPTGMSLSGSIRITDQPVQASICAPMGDLIYEDDPTWDREKAKQVYHSDYAPFDKFFIMGNLVVNKLKQEEMSYQRHSDKYWCGGGTVRYDEHLIEDALGQTDNQNYHVSMGQRFSYYKTYRELDEEKKE